MKYILFFSRSHDLGEPRDRRSESWRTFQQRRHRWRGLHRTGLWPALLRQETHGQALWLLQAGAHFTHTGMEPEPNQTVFYLVRFWQKNWFRGERGLHSCEMSGGPTGPGRISLWRGWHFSCHGWEWAVEQTTSGWKYLFSLADLKTKLN